MFQIAEKAQVRNPSVPNSPKGSSQYEYLSTCIDELVLMFKWLPFYHTAFCVFHTIHDNKSI